MMIPDRSSEKVTIEDLLRLKRAERPSPEFWARFEQDLRAKQLAAIVEKRPWWQAVRIPQSARVIARLQVSAGAAAILAFSLIVVNHYNGRMVSLPETVITEPTASATQVDVTSGKIEQVVIVAADPVFHATPATFPAKPIALAVPVRTEVAVTDSSRAVQPTDLTAMIPWGLNQADEDAFAAPALVSTRLLQAVASTSDTGITSLLGNTLVADTPAETGPVTVAEVKTTEVVQSASPRELRRTKLLTGLVLANNSESTDSARAVHSRDVAANDISEDQLYDSSRRLGVGGDRFTVKF